MILVTGSSGYLGRHVCAVLRERSVPFIGLSRADCDLTKAFRCSDECSLILHLAAATPKLPEDYRDWDAALKTVLMAGHVVTNRTRPVLLVSSHVAATPDSSAYAAAKAMSELLLMFSQRMDGDGIVRLPGLFGLPRRNGTVYEAALRGDFRDEYGPYPAMHVGDAAREIVRIATQKERPAFIHRLQYAPGELESAVHEFADQLVQ